MGNPQVRHEELDQEHITVSQSRQIVQLFDALSQRVGALEHSVQRRLEVLENKMADSQRCLEALEDVQTTMQTEIVVAKEFIPLEHRVHDLEERLDDMDNSNLGQMDIGADQMDEDSDGPAGDARERGSEQDSGQDSREFNRIARVVNSHLRSLTESLAPMKNSAGALIVDFPGTPGQLHQLTDSRTRELLGDLQIDSEGSACDRMARLHAGVGLSPELLATTEL